MPNYKVVDADVLDADLQTVADAIKAKAGTEEALEFPSGFASAVESIETGGGGDHTQEDGLITGTLTEYTNDRVTTMRSALFESYGKITKVNFQAVTAIPSEAFYKANNLEEAIFPSVISVANYSFRQCGKLKNIYLPKVESLSQQAFDGCTSLESVSFPNLNRISAGNVFARCTMLKCADFGSRLGSGPFSYVYNQTFYECAALKTVILRCTENVCPLSGTNAFYDTPFAEGGTGGTVYVPAALIESYQTATNWSTLYAAGTCNFVAIEGSEYE